MATRANVRSLDLSRESRGILGWICLLIAANQIGFGLIIPVTALYAEDFGVSKTAIGLTIAVYGLARFVANMPAGQLADRRGRKATLAAGGLLTVIGSALCALAPNYPVFLLARFINGAGAAVVLTGGQVVAADISSSHNRGRVMAIYQGVFLSAVALGAWPGGWLATHYGLASPFWVNAALAGVVTLLALVFVPETRPEPGSAAARAASELHLGLREQLALVIRIPGFVLISAVSFVAFFARTGGVFNVIPLFAEDHIGLATEQFGLGISLITITGVLLVYPSGMLVDRLGRKGVIVVSTVVSGAAMLLFTTAGSFSAFLAAGLIWGIGTGVAGPAPAAYAADLAPKGMIAPALSIYRTIADLGYVTGALVLGFISDLASSEAALVFTACLLFCSGAAFFLRAPETLEQETKLVA
ncbi:MAG: MFS transporter [Thermomicrobiales bacterium]|nr:MFS transporter [Thermomicrobiales bacterium]